jgi:RimK family alpha-L-glutamate ligase
MAAFTVVSHRITTTNARLGTVLSPTRALASLGAGDIALGRLDVLPTLDGVEPGLWALDRLADRGVTVLNPRRVLTAAHDKLATARALARAGVPHPQSTHLTDRGQASALAPPIVLKPRFGSWGEDVVRCETPDQVDAALADVSERRWFGETGALAQELVPPRGHDLRLLVAAGCVVGAVRRIAAEGEWRTNVALGAKRLPVDPPPETRALAVAAAAAIGGDLVGIDLLPLPRGGWTVLEINGAVEFNGAYSLDDDVFNDARRALLAASDRGDLQPAA